jgi:uncharacterized membrane protein
VPHGFIKDASGFATIDYPGPNLGTAAYSINSNGQIVGSYTSLDFKAHGFIKDGANFISFDYPGATHTYPYGINDAGQIVGTYFSLSGSYHGFLKDGPNFISIDYPGASTTEVHGINNRGQIVGFATVPEPSTLMLFAAATVLFGGCYRARFGRSAQR